LNLRLAIDSRHTLLRGGRTLKERAEAADGSRVDGLPQPDFSESLADLELLVFGGTLEDESLVQRFLAADEAFTAHIVALLVREPVLLH
jgi:hypothetical protein